MKWTIHNLANHSIRYGKFDTKEEAAVAAKSQGEIFRIDEARRTIEFRGIVRL